MEPNDWTPFQGLELVLADGSKQRVKHLDFVIDDHPRAEPRRWRLTALSPTYIQQLLRWGLVQQLD